MSPPTRQGFAIFGAGIFATEAYIPALAALGKAAPPLKAVYSRSAKSAEGFSAAAVTALGIPAPDVYHDGENGGGVDAILARKDISSVLIVLPIPVQPSIILKALQAGKHVLSEKPVAPDVAGGINLIEQCRSEFQGKGLVWRVAENYEVEPGIQEVGRLIGNGAIGKVIGFKACILNYVSKDSKYYKTPWRTVPEYQGGFLVDGGVHTIAVLRVLLPQPITHLSSFASLNKEYLAPHDTIHAIAKASSHYSGTLEMTFAFPTTSKPVSAKDAYVVTGTEGYAAISIDGGFIKAILTTEKKETVVKEKMRGVELELGSFFDAADSKEGIEPFGNPVDALKDVAFIEAALKSNGALVDLGLLVHGLE
ncbi:oxidoreductase family protein [Guyanagaster necrorhizus]|uniref:Oxidoreductase family protein n=1 Tax=Guyanagaster necrorhizus TaxID=856835 RepID=A0A9P7VRK2_9AGAR|nr:oxidoreductase family protein [Guyanagaster necrorhizus MCA 3950]KAG7445420.1 oxidoreductase family protein [Guyanagaster necrorhizus MCA 3950]